jgi:hypothetical protein
MALSMDEAVKRASLRSTSRGQFFVVVGGEREMVALCQREGKELQLQLQLQAGNSSPVNWHPSLRRSMATRV